MDLINFILIYFVSKHLSNLTAYLCWRQEHILKLCHRAQRCGIRLQIITNFHRLPELMAYDFTREGVVLDTNCTDAALVLNKASVNRAFIHRYSWLLLRNSTTDISIVESTLATVAVLPDADVSWSFTDNLIDVYRVKEDQPLIVNHYGLPRNCTVQGLDRLWRELPSPVTRRRDLNNIYIKSVCVVTQPQNFKTWSDVSNREIDPFPKVTYPIMNLCAQDLHFRFNMMQVELYGEESNGTFNGLVGLIQRQVVEIGATSMFMRADRWRVLHYIAETVPLLGAFIFLQPAQSAVCNVFLLPFSRGVWAASGALVLLATLLLAALSRSLLSHDRTLVHLTLPESFTFAIGAICQQGLHVVPEVVSVRLVMFSTLTAALFAFTAYSAKIVAILQSPSEALQTIGDLTRSPFTLGVQNSTYRNVYFAESTDPATQHLYRRKLQPQGERAYLSVVDGIARVRAGLFAYQVELTSGYDIISKSFMEHEKCGLKEIEAFKLPMVAITIKKHSGYRELLGSRLRWQRETGLMGHAKRIWMAQKPKCTSSGGGFLSVGLADVLPAFQVLGGGALVAIFILMVEVAMCARAATPHRDPVIISRNFKCNRRNIILQK